jgi:hypothetical protein
LLLGFVRDFGALAAAYRVSGDKRCGRRTSGSSDPATRMNPTRLYSQAIQGLNRGRATRLAGIMAAA